MSLGLCVTQGAEGGIRVQNETIALTKDRGERLVFLYVADISLLNNIAVGVLRGLAQNEMIKMGRFILALALERVLARRVKAEAIVRSGKPDKVLPRAMCELEATTVVLKSPAGETRVVESAELEQLHSISK